MWMMAAFLANSALNFVVSLLVAKFLGPAEYGRFALTLSAAVVVQLLLFDWLRFAAVRFYSAQGRLNEPNVRATFDSAFLALAFLASLIAVALYVARLDLPLTPDLAAMTVASAIFSGLFDYSGALLRARFLDRSYGALVVVKNVLAVLLAVGGAYLFQSAPVAIAGMMVSVVGSLLAARAGLSDDFKLGGRFEHALALKFLSYGMPIIGANMLYQSIPLLDRALVSQTLGFAEAGQLSLAYDIGVRIVGVIGSALDVILFQLAVLKERTSGASSARAQVSRNMGVVFAVVAPAVLGCWLILPSFERLFVPESYRGPFAHYFTLMAPALLAFALTHFAINPAYQISHRLAPLIIAALTAVVANLIVIGLPSAAPDASIYALAQSAASISGMLALTLMLFWLEPMWPSARDILGAIAACGAMYAATIGLRTMTPGIVTMAAQIVLGGAVYLAAAAALDLAGLRSLFGPKLAARFAKAR